MLARPLGGSPSGSFNTPLDEPAGVEGIASDAVEVKVRVEGGIS